MMLAQLMLATLNRVFGKNAEVPVEKKMKFTGGYDPAGSQRAIELGFRQRSTPVQVRRPTYTPTRPIRSTVDVPQGTLRTVKKQDNTTRFSYR